MVGYEIQIMNMKDCEYLYYLAADLSFVGVSVYLMQI